MNVLSLIITSRVDSHSPTSSIRKLVLSFPKFQNRSRSRQTLFSPFSPPPTTWSATVKQSSLSLSRSRNFKITERRTSYGSRLDSGRLATCSKEERGTHLPETRRIQINSRTSPMMMQQKFQRGRATRIGQLQRTKLSRRPWQTLLATLMLAHLTATRN